MFSWFPGPLFRSGPHETVTPFTPSLRPWILQEFWLILDAIFNPNLVAKFHEISSLTIYWNTETWLSIGNFWFKSFIFLLKMTMCGEILSESCFRTSSKKNLRASQWQRTVEKTVQPRDQANLPNPINHRIFKSAETTVDRTCSKNEWERPRSEKMPIRSAGRNETAWSSKSVISQCNENATFFLDIRYKSDLYFIQLH